MTTVASLLGHGIDPTGYLTTPSDTLRLVIETGLDVLGEAERKARK